MSILVTGGLGAIGSWVIRRLLEDGRNPIIFDIKTDTTLIEDVKKEVPIVQGDILDLAKLIRVIKEYKIRRIIHLAAELSQEVRRLDPYLEVRVLVDGTANVLETARLMEIERFVYASSRAVYGKLDPRFTHPTYDPIPEEEAIPGGSTPLYSAGKFLMEKVGLQYASLGLDFVALRFGTVYGPGKIMTHGTKKIRAIHTLIVINAMKGEATKIPKGGDGLSDCVYFKDIANGVVRACFAEKPESRIYNISAGKGYSFKDWAKVIREVFPHISLEVGPGPLTEFGLQGGILDITRARRELAYEPEYPLKRGVEDFVKQMNRLKFIG